MAGIFDVRDVGQHGRLDVAGNLKLLRQQILFHDQMVDLLELRGISPYDIDHEQQT